MNGSCQRNAQPEENDDAGSFSWAGRTSSTTDLTEVWAAFFNRSRGTQGVTLAASDSPVSDSIVFTIR